MQPAGDQEEAGAGEHRARVARRAQLRQQLVRADDRPGDQVGKERLQDRDVHERGRARLAAVDVDDVRDRLEGEERDADRQDDLDDRERRPEADAVKKGVEFVDEEAEVLEGAQKRQVERDREDERALARDLRLRARDHLGRERVDDTRARSGAGPSASPPTRRTTYDASRMNGRHALG